MVTKEVGRKAIIIISGIGISILFALSVVLHFGTMIDNYKENQKESKMETTIVNFNNNGTSRILLMNYGVHCNLDLNLENEISYSDLQNMLMLSDYVLLRSDLITKKLYIEFYANTTEKIDPPLNYYSNNMPVMLFRADIENKWAERIMYKIGILPPGKKFDFSNYTVNVRI